MVRCFAKEKFVFGVVEWATPCGWVSTRRREHPWIDKLALAYAQLPNSKSEPSDLVRTGWNNGNIERKVGAKRSKQ